MGHNELVHKVIETIVKKTRYSMTQVMGVLELVSKYDGKAIYHMTYKQKQIYRIMLSLLGGLVNGDRDGRKAEERAEDGKENKGNDKDKRKGLQDKEG